MVAIRENLIITTSEVEYAIKKLKPSYTGGTNYIPNIVYKKLAFYIVPQMVQLYNYIIEFQSIPLAWKLSKVVPTFKKGDRHDIKNYQPKSLIPVICKIFEKIIKNRLLDFINGKTSLLSRNMAFVQAPQQLQIIFSTNIIIRRIWKIYLFIFIYKV